LIRESINSPTLANFFAISARRLEWLFLDSVNHQSLNAFPESGTFQDYSLVNYLTKTTLQNQQFLNRYILYLRVWDFTIPGINFQTFPIYAVNSYLVYYIEIWLVRHASKFYLVSSGFRRFATKSSVFHQFFERVRVNCRCGCIP
jgi:hypothetical protein